MHHAIGLLILDAFDHRMTLSLWAEYLILLQQHHRPMWKEFSPCVAS